MDFITFLSTYGADILVISVMLLCKFFGNHKTKEEMDIALQKKIDKLSKRISKSVEQADKDVALLEELSQKKE